MMIPDNLDLYERHEREQERELNKLPVCSNCEEPIQDETAYYIDGEFICLACMAQNYEVRVEDYVE
jgi:formylmethanofuran dehydrogenase subunit E